MRKKDLALALLVVILWGSNFTVIKLGLNGLEPMLLVALRFTFSALPAVFFVKAPKTRWYYVLAYGLTAGVGQYACDIYALKLGMPAGIASVILQSQLFFTLGFGLLFLKERIRGRQIGGMILSGFGLFLIGGNLGSTTIKGIPPISFVLMVMAAIFWGLSNIVVRKASRLAVSEGQKLNPLSLVVWASLIPILPFFALAMLLESPESVGTALATLKLPYLGIVLHLALLGTLFGFSSWNRLLARYPAGRVASLSLLVPVSGLLTAWLVIGERLDAYQAVGILVVIAGLLLAHFGIPGLTQRFGKVPINESKE